MALRAACSELEIQEPHTQARPPAKTTPMSQSEPSPDEFYRACLRLRQLCVEKRDFILKKLKVSKGQNYTNPDRYRARLQSQLRVYGVDMEEWTEGLQFISWANRLAHLDRRLSIGIIRADIACVARHSGQYIHGASSGPVQQARLEAFATSKI